VSSVSPPSFSLAQGRAQLGLARHRCTSHMPTEIQTKYENLAKQIEREDLLVDKRTSWLLVSEAFLFAAALQALVKALELSSAKENRHWACGAFAFAAALLVSGAVVAFLIKQDILAALHQLWRLKYQFRKDPALVMAVFRPGPGQPPSSSQLLVEPFYHDDKNPLSTAEQWNPKYETGFVVRILTYLVWACGAMGGFAILGAAAAEFRWCNTDPSLSKDTTPPERDCRSVERTSHAGAPIVNVMGPNINVEGASVIMGEPTRPQLSCDRPREQHLHLPDGGLESLRSDSGLVEPPDRHCDSGA
jgi:hypothetical protein